MLSRQASYLPYIVAPFEAFNLFLMLAMGHFVADFALQGDRMAVEKCPGQGVVLGWGWWLVAHAGIHGFFVAWITGVPLVGLAEWLLHGLIDLGKCRRSYGMHGSRSAPALQVCLDLGGCELFPRLWADALARFP